MASEREEERDLASLAEQIAQEGVNLAKDKTTGHKMDAEAERRWKCASADLRWLRRRHRQLQLVEQILSEQSLEATRETTMQPQAPDSGESEEAVPCFSPTSPAEQEATDTIETSELNVNTEQGKAIVDSEQNKVSGNSKNPTESEATTFTPMEPAPEMQATVEADAPMARKQRKKQPAKKLSSMDPGKQQKRKHVSDDTRKMNAQARSHVS